MAPTNKKDKQKGAMHTEPVKRFAKPRKTAAEMTAAEMTADALKKENAEMKKRLAHYEQSDEINNGTPTERDGMRNVITEIRQENEGLHAALKTAELKVNDSCKKLSEQAGELRKMAVHPRFRAIDTISRAMGELNHEDQAFVLSKIVENIIDERKETADVFARRSADANKQYDDILHIARAFK